MDTNQFSDLSNHLGDELFPLQTNAPQNFETHSANPEPISRTRQRTWELLDQLITPADFAQLETDLMTCPEARKAYCEIILLDSDLRALLWKKPENSSVKVSSDFKPRTTE